jgi:Uma2 family endonuclease
MALRTPSPTRAAQPTADRAIDEDALMALGSHARVEVIDGEWVEMSPVGGEHHDIAGNIYDLWKPFVSQNRLGLVYFDGLIFLLHRKLRKLKGALVPDVSFIRKQDVPKTWDRDRPFPGSPTIAVEIVSPNDDADLLLRRVQMYLNAKTEQVWVVYPAAREIHVYLLDGGVRRYQDGMSIDMGALMSGLTVSVSAVFVLPELE